MRKNKIASTVLGLSLAMLLGGCKDRIVVNFTYEPSEPKVGQTVQFTSLADGGETFDWTFQNEATSSVYRSTRVRRLPTAVMHTWGWKAMASIFSPTRAEWK